MLFNLINDLFVNHFRKFNNFILMKHVIIRWHSDFKRVAKCHTGKTKTNQSRSDYVGSALNSTNLLTIFTTEEKWFNRTGCVWERHRIFYRFCHNSLFWNKSWQKSISESSDPENTVNIANTREAILDFFRSFLYQRKCFFHCFCQRHYQWGDCEYILHFNWLSSRIEFESDVSRHYKWKRFVSITIFFELMIHSSRARTCHNIINSNANFPGKCL